LSGDRRFPLSEEAPLAAHDGAGRPLEVAPPPRGFRTAEDPLDPPLGGAHIAKREPVTACSYADHLAAEGSRRLVFVCVQAHGAKTGSLVLVGNAGMKAARNVPAEGATERGALADALGWTPAAPACQVVNAFDHRAKRSLRRGLPKVS